MTYVAAKNISLFAMVSKNIRAYFKAIGRRGGKERARRSSPATLSAQARNAVVSRWLRKRFGADNFQTLALPGWEIVDSGLRDLVNGSFTSVQALAVAELRPRLRFLGVPVPDGSPHIPNPRTLLYHTMETEQGDMAYVRFCALLERMNSFCDSLASIISIPQHTAHRNRRWTA